MQNQAFRRMNAIENKKKLQICANLFNFAHCVCAHEMT